MKDIPRAALLLGLAGLIPFLWGAATHLSETLAMWSLANLGPRFTAPFVLLNYGQIILAFMAGVLWGFATRSEPGRAFANYAFSVVPALWVFFLVGAGPASSAIYLIAGFLAVLSIDWSHWNQGLAPPWWMRLRIPLTVIAIACLAVLV